MKFTILSISFLFILIFPNVNAQVTIGSDNEPRKGSLLDIKQKNSTGHELNAKGGLGLPRVKLISPTILTIDNINPKSNYVGVTVYNIGNTNIPEGIYYWNGDKWMLSVSVNNYGADGQLLTSNGSGAFSWSNFVLPEYSYHKPTQILVFKANKAIEKKYTYPALTTGGSGSHTGSVKPKSETFTNDFVYTETLNIRTTAPNEKYMLLGTSCVIEMMTIGGFTPAAGFWQIVEVDVLIDNESVQRNQRLYPTPAKSDKSIYVDMFSIVPLDKFGTGNHEMKIRISNIENTFPNNLFANEVDGGFVNSTTATFYTVNIVDVNLVLYESD